VDIRVTLPDDSKHRLRRRASVSSRSAALRWGEDKERNWYQELTHPESQIERKEALSLEAFASRFVDGYARANRHKPSGIAAKESILKVHLVPKLGAAKLDAISTEMIQRLKHELRERSPKTVNNVLTVLNMLLKKAVEWGVIERMPCAIRLLPIPKPSAGFFDFDQYEALVTAARALDLNALLIVLLGGEAGLRCGEIIALEWSDVDFRKRQLTVERSEWRGHVTVPKGGRLRYIPMTARLALALRDQRHLGSARVVYQPNGAPLSQWMVRDHVERAARAAGLKTAGVHRLRHTFCSRLAMRCAPARAIQELAGHQDLATTQRYMHLSPAAVEEAIRLLEQPRQPSSFGDILETRGEESRKSL
jgi:integrase